MNAILERVDRWLSAVEYLLIGGLTLLALAIGTMQVVLRYVFNTGYTWSEEAFTLSTISAMLFAGVRAVRDDKHVRVELLPLLVSKRVRRLLQLFAHGAALALCVYFAYSGLLYVLFVNMIESVSPDTGIPDWIIFSLVPLTLGLFAVRYVVRIVRVLRNEEIETTRGLLAVALAETDLRP